jgi:hypothetical protein
MGCVLFLNTRLNETGEARASSKNRSVHGEIKESFSISMTPLRSSKVILAIVSSVAWVLNKG